MGSKFRVRPPNSSFSGANPTVGTTRFGNPINNTFSSSGRMDGDIGLGHRVVVRGHVATKRSNKRFGAHF